VADVVESFGRCSPSKFRSAYAGDGDKSLGKKEPDAGGGGYGPPEENATGRSSARDVRRASSAPRPHGQVTGSEGGLTWAAWLRNEDLYHEGETPNVVRVYARQQNRGALLRAPEVDGAMMKVLLAGHEKLSPRLNGSPLRGKGGQRMMARTPVHTLPTLRPPPAILAGQRGRDMIYSPGRGPTTRRGNGWDEESQSR